MSSPVIVIEDLWKYYALGEFGARTLRDEFQRFRENMKSRSDSVNKVHRAEKAEDDKVFWALQGLNLEINQGEILGLIGPNGAGKSTLLKILSRITGPSRGKIYAKGRIASLLEVGTGFHPELTGRENIFLNGAIMGMNTKQIARRFDEIVEFAGLSRHIDTPVKRYSSGMYVRLGFSIAAHLECDILIVDEVLAVGDYNFQKSCMDRIYQMSKEGGKTVVFVSHNMNLVKQICTSGAIVTNGTAEYYEDINRTIHQYTNLYGGKNETATFQPRTNSPSITRIAVTESLLEQFVVQIEIDFQSPLPLRPIPGIIIYDEFQNSVVGSNARVHQMSQNSKSGTLSGTILCNFGMLPIHGGQYTASIWLGDTTQDFDVKESAITFKFPEKNSEKNAKFKNQHGPLNIIPTWEVH